LQKHSCFVRCVIKQVCVRGLLLYSQDGVWVGFEYVSREDAGLHTLLWPDCCWPQGSFLVPRSGTGLPKYVLGMKPQVHLIQGRRLSKVIMLKNTQTGNFNEVMVSKCECTCSGCQVGR